MAKPKTRSAAQPRTAFYVLLLLAIASPIVAGLFFGDARGVAYGWIIVAIWTGVLLATMAFGIFYYAQFVLASHKGENWWEGAAMILRAASLFEAPTRSTGLKTAAPAFPGEELLPSSFALLQAGMLPSHLVLALNKGNRFARAAGPGFVSLRSGERISQVIDLRRHVRAQELTINTQDGIPLDTSVTVTFRVKPSSTQTEEQDSRLPYSYDSNAIFQISQLSSVDQDDRVLPWSEQIAPQAATFLVSEFAQHTLDQLSQDPGVFRGLERRVREELIRAFDPFGVQIQTVRVAAENMPEQIVAQRLATWRAPLESRLRIMAAEGNEEALQRFKLARARAQIEIIEKIMASIDEMRRTEDAHLSDIVALRVVDVLEDASAKSSAKLLLPSRTHRSFPSLLQDRDAEWSSDTGEQDRE